MRILVSEVSLHTGRPSILRLLPSRDSHPPAHNLPQGRSYSNIQSHHFGGCGVQNLNNSGPQRQVCASLRQLSSTENGCVDLTCRPAGSAKDVPPYSFSDAVLGWESETKKAVGGLHVHVHCEHDFFNLHHSGTQFFPGNADTFLDHKIGQFHLPGE